MITIDTAYKHAILRSLKGGTGSETKTASGAIATFDDAIAGAVQSLTYSFTPSQSGTGDPSPTNPRSINGIDSLDIINKDDLTTPTQTQTKTVNFSETVYGGTGNEAGEFTNECDIVLDLSALSWNYQSANNRFVSTSIASVVKAPPNNSTVVEKAACEIYKVDISNNTASNAYDNIIAVSSAGNIQIRDTSLNGDLDALATRLDGKKFVYPLATPTTLSVDPVSMNTYAGDNNIYADIPNSSIEVEYLTKKPMSKKDRILSYLPLIYGRKELL